LATSIDLSPDHVSGADVFYVHMSTGRLQLGKLRFQMYIAQRNGFRLPMDKRNKMYIEQMRGSPSSYRSFDLTDRFGVDSVPFR
jgi:hypothetical protein